MRILRAALMYEASAASPAELTVRLAAVCGTTRTPAGVRVRLWRLGLAVAPALLTAQRVAWLCGVHPATVTSWIRRGWLCAGRSSPGPVGGEYRIAPAALTAFLVAHLAQVDVGRMPRSPYQAQVWADLQRDPWLTVAEAACWLGWSRRSTCRLVAAGHLAAVRAPSYAQSRGWYWRIRRSAVLAYRAAREESA